MSRSAEESQVLRPAGHLSLESLERELGGLGEDVTGRLLVDCLGMTGYDGDARERFVAWNREHRGVIDRVAVVTDRPLWQMILSTMALASGQRMRGFRDVASAKAWLAERRGSVPPG